MEALQKIRTSFKEGNGLNDYYISAELQEQRFQELNKKINIIGTHYHNQEVLGVKPSSLDIKLLAPPRFVYFFENGVSVFIQSTYIGLDHTKRYNNHLNHALVFKNINTLYNPLHYMFSPSMLTSVPERRDEFYLEPVSWSKFQTNHKDVDFNLKNSVTNEQLKSILALLIESKIDSKPLILLGDDKQCQSVLYQLFSTLPLQLAKYISFSTLTFSKLDKKNSLLDINCYTPYSLKLGHIPSYKTTQEIMADAKIFSFNYFDLNGEVHTTKPKYENISAFLTQEKTTLKPFFTFCEAFSIALEDLPFMIKLFSYTKSNNIPAKELYDVIDFYFKHTTQENSFDFIYNRVNFESIKNDTTLFIKIFTFIYPKIYRETPLSLKVENAMLKNTFDCLSENNHTVDDFRKKIDLIKSTAGEHTLTTYFLSNFEKINLSMKSANLNILLSLDEIFLPLIKKQSKKLPHNYFSAIANKIQKEPKLIAQRLRFYNTLDFEYLLAFLNALSINEVVFIKAITEKKESLKGFIDNFILNQMYEPVIKIYLYQMSQSSEGISNILNYKESSRYMLFTEFHTKVNDKKSIDTFTSASLEKFKDDGKFLNLLLNDKNFYNKNEIMTSVNNFLRSNYNKHKKYIEVPDIYINNSQYKFLTLLNIEQQIDKNSSTDFDKIIKDIDKLNDFGLQQQLMQKIEEKKNPVTIFDVFKSIFKKEEK
jgi:hypothetical protein